MTFALTCIFIIMVFWRPQEWLIPSLYGWPLLDVVIYGALLSLLIETNEGKLRFPKGPVSRKPPSKPATGRTNNYIG